MPILYLDFPGVDEEEPADEAVSLVKRFHWVDWRDNRFADVGSREYRLGVAEMAARLVEANRVAEHAEIVDLAIQRADDEDEGVIELLARFEVTLPDVSATTQEIGSVIVEIGALAEESGEEIQKPANQTFAKGLNLVRRFAKNLAEPVARIKSLGDDFTRQLLMLTSESERSLSERPKNPRALTNFARSLIKSGSLLPTRRPG
ncbi:hypothetical protein ACFOYW_09195 [Gryllotalpicola reticulitermitis]|uniref:Uncharacterized protein n=1 Tax=Gryllotalpicola reticulitermitis TaxID=1184153 RepID=A0ABV8Q8P4_9MICO